MATLAELLVDVRTELAEPVAGYWTDAQLTGYINRAAVDFSVDTGILQAPPMQANVVADQAGYILPDECPGPQAIVRVYHNGNELTPTTVGALASRGAKPHEDTGTPKNWYGVTHGGNNCLMLYPIPEQALVNGLVLWFWKVAADMAAPADECEIPDEYSPGVVYGATMRGFIAKKEVEQAGVYRGWYQEQAAKAKAWVRAAFTAGVRDGDARSRRGSGL